MGSLKATRPLAAYLFCQGREPMPSLTWSLIEGVVQGHLLEKPQKILTSEECRFSSEDRLRSPNSSRLGVCVQVCVCVHR